MKMLLDTHVLLWWLRDDARLRPRIRQVIAGRDNQVFVSLASFWEIAVKVRKGRLDVSAPAVWRDALDEGFSILPITQDHLLAFERVEVIDHHGDPFDILLVAQSKAENAVLVTADRHMGRYGVPCLGVS